MQTLSRLKVLRRETPRAVAAWLAIVAILGTLPGPAPALTSRASCGPHPAMGAGVCSGCHRAAPASAPYSLARIPCCGCEISSDPLPAAPPSALLLERPVSQWHGLDAAMGAAGFAARTPSAAQHLAASDPPGARPNTPASPTILRL